MAGEINFFRKRFLGGFDKQDVVDYIAEQADERNKLNARIEKVESDYETLVEEARVEQVSLIEKAKSEREALLEESRIEREALIEKAGAERETLTEKFEAERRTLIDKAEAEHEALIKRVEAEREAFNKQTEAEREAFEAEKKALNAEIEALKQRCNEIEKQAQDYKVASLISAGDALEEVKRSLDGYQGVVEAAISRARDEFMLAADTVAVLPQIFERTGETVSSLIEQIYTERDHFNLDDMTQPE